VAYVPPQVIFASTGAKADQDGTKDSVSNIRETGVFCVNIVEYAMLDAMNASSASLAKQEDEFAHAGLEALACDTIAGFRVAGAPASLECKVTQIITLAGPANFAVFGEVTGVHMRDDCLVDGLFDVKKFKPLARLGYKDYSFVDHSFTLSRPDD
jgi:flavin reductase (DIM6/NTAB) family NADH-FMN oxidoreductase RutF